MLGLAAERTWGANVLGMPVEHTRRARAALGPDPLLAVTQLCVLGPDRSRTAGPARATAAAALPNRRALLEELGHRDVDALGERLVDAIVAHGDAGAIARRVHEHLDSRRRSRQPPPGHRQAGRPAAAAVGAARRAAPALTGSPCGRTSTQPGARPRVIPLVAAEVVGIPRSPQRPPGARGHARRRRPPGPRELSGYEAPPTVSAVRASPRSQAWAWSVS